MGRVIEVSVFATRWSLANTGHQSQQNTNVPFRFESASSNTKTYNTREKSSINAEVLLDPFTHFNMVFGMEVEMILADF